MNESAVVKEIFLRQSRLSKIPYIKRINSGPGDIRKCRGTFSMFTRAYVWVPHCFKNLSANKPDSVSRKAGGHHLSGRNITVTILLPTLQPVRR